MILIKLNVALFASWPLTMCESSKLQNKTLFTSVRNRDSWRQRDPCFVTPNPQEALMASEVSGFRENELNRPSAT